MIRRILFAVFLVVACATGAAADTYEDAVSKAAEQGHAGAQNELGVMYSKGQGVPQDYHEAAKWYRKAADQGHAGAQFNLGGMYHVGQGVPQDDQEAAKWWRKAAEQGDASAQGMLGAIYYLGQAVPQDFIRAHMWYNVAAAALSGADAMELIKLRDSVTSRMTAEQIEKAQEMARRCQQSKFTECD